MVVHIQHEFYFCIKLLFLLSRKSLESRHKQDLNLAKKKESFISYQKWLLQTRPWNLAPSGMKCLNSNNALAQNARIIKKYATLGKKNASVIKSMQSWRRGLKCCEEAIFEHDSSITHCWAIHRIVRKFPKGGLRTFKKKQLEFKFYFSLDQSRDRPSVYQGVREWATLSQGVQG